MDKIGIYVHFPFCVKKCNYCNFNSYANKNDMQLKYFQALLSEIAMYKNEKVEVDTIFIGGGTPSVMFDGAVSTVISEIRKNFKVLESAEITIEANPNSITKTKIQEWKECGVNRVSIGLQSANANTLKLLGRTHTRQDYIQAIKDVQSAGIHNVNTDCLIGLPRQKLSDVRRMLGLVTKLDCSHISVYSLILEEDTPLFHMVNSRQVKLPKEEKVLGMYNFANKFLNEKGFVRYEVSNFSKDGFECKHNLNTWKMHSYLGFGAGAHGFFNNKRYSNVETIEDYIRIINISQKPIKETEKLTKTQMYEEFVMLGLRTKFGINIKHIQEIFGIDILKKYAEKITYFKKLGFVDIENGNLFVTDEGMPVLNKIILELVT
ncbi:MAG: radical SAM family heme chaperone HemW [Clostridia bacterium]|nr:radical SAM family heme chaperone HemW [Clostridia bacterium]